VAVLDPEVVVLEVDVEVGVDEGVFDPLPDDAGHLVTVEFYDGALYLDLLHCIPHVLGIRACVILHVHRAKYLDIKILYRMPDPPVSLSAWPNCDWNHCPRRRPRRPTASPCDRVRRS